MQCSYYICKIETRTSSGRRNRSSLAEHTTADASTQILQRCRGGLVVGLLSSLTIQNFFFSCVLNFYRSPQIDIYFSTEPSILGHASGFVDKGLFAKRKTISADRNQSDGVIPVVLGNEYNIRTSFCVW